MEHCDTAVDSINNKLARYQSLKAACKEQKISKSAVMTKGCEENLTQFSMLNSQPQPPPQRQ
jgi:hypothetical protein